MEKFVEMDDFKSLNVGFALDEGMQVAACYRILIKFQQ